MENKVKEYSERHKFWIDKSMSQFGYSINLFTTISIGILIYQIRSKNEYYPLLINFNTLIKWDTILFSLSLFFTFLSFLFGIISVTSRLYDIRITRNIIKARKKSIQILKRKLPNKIPKKQNMHQLNNYLSVMFKGVNLISDDDYSDYTHLKNIFLKLKTESKLLGDFAWIAHKYQIVLLVLSIVLYLCS